MVSPIHYLIASTAFLVGTYLTDYYTRPNLKHSLWFLFNISFGAVLGSYMHQQGFKFMTDALYLIGNAMTFYAASCYYTQDNDSIIFTGLLCSIFGMLYGVGVLRLFRWGLDLRNYHVYVAALSILTIVMSWSIYRMKIV